MVTQRQKGCNNQQRQNRQNLVGTRVDNRFGEPGSYSVDRFLGCANVGCDARLPRASMPNLRPGGAFSRLSEQGTIR
jgi:hypothetical protein